MGGMGMGGGGGLLGDLLAGGLGYMAGRSSQAGQNQQYPPQYQQYPQQYPPQYQQGAPQYQQAAPQYQAQPSQGQAGDQNSAAAQLKLLGHLRDSGMLTDDEFEQEKQKILNGS